MFEKKHQWAEYYSPRNGRISIQACQDCGIVKSMALNKIKCIGIPNQKKVSRLRGWTTEKPFKNVTGHQIL